MTRPIRKASTSGAMSTSAKMRRRVLVMFLIEYQGRLIAHHQPIGRRMHQEVLLQLEKVEETKPKIAEGVERRAGRRWKKMR